MAMIQLSKLEKRIGIRTSQEKFFNSLKYNMSRFPQLAPESLKSFELLGGGAEVKTGSITCWKYCLDGALVMSLKAKVEALDDARNIIYFDAIEGDLKRLYKIFKAKLEVSGGELEVSIEFGKAREDAPNPNAYLDLADKVFKSLDAHLSK